MQSTEPTYTETEQTLIDRTLALGAYKAAIIPADAVKTDPVFRDICASNGCGMYDKCWTCPPCVGTVEEVTKKLRGFSRVLVFQTVGQLEDSYDIEGMDQAAVDHRQLVLKLQKTLSPDDFDSMMFLTVGGCRLCPVCTKREGKPCRHPDLALPSLESYCIHVSELAKAGNMKYINGPNTTTFFSALFFNPKTEGSSHE